MPFHVVVTDYLFDTLDPFLTELKELPDIDVSTYQERDPEKLIPLVRDADVVFVHHAKISGHNLMFPTMLSC